MAAPRKIAVLLAAALAGFAVAALVGVAVAKTFTLGVAKDAPVTNTSGATTRENIVVDARGFAVYALTGDSRRHPKCTRADGCFKVWHPVTVSSRKKLGKASGVRGRLGVWHRNGLLQVTLAGHPLYTFAADTHKGSARGDGIRSFHGTWTVLEVAGAAPGATTAPTTTTTDTNTTPASTSTSPCPYPPYC
jgi:predicted lipoprotein with Yx(FWY)xxD motif